MTCKLSHIQISMLLCLKLGGILILGVGGFFCEWKSFSGGWPSIFYMSGGISILFCFIWSLMVFDSPNQHPRISQREREFIIAHTHHQPSHKTVIYYPGILCRLL